MTSALGKRSFVATTTRHLRSAKIVSATVYAMNIPFVDRFSHNLGERDRSDSIIVKLTTGSGISGFGEGLPRPYVTGETRDASVPHILHHLLPEIMGVELGGADVHDALAFVDRLLPRRIAEGGPVWNACRSAVELATLDCLLSARDVSLGAVLPPRAAEVTYSGVITSGSAAVVARVARRIRAAGLGHVKVKVTCREDVATVRLVRDILGPDVSIRLDANAAFSRDEALRFLREAAEFGIDCIEQPIPRGDPSELAALRAASPVPVMADESVVTRRDAEELIRHGACDLFNLRVSKCGGILDTLAMAELAASAGVGIQLGCQVGESAILSAAGRHVAAHLDGLRFVEGSYGTHLLVEDIADEDLTFGHGGRAPVLTGPGLGVTIREDLVARHADYSVSVR
ncbi:MAG: mandelate racemase/muconate lactonizing enzyme family protein [Planctomycetota bacterium]